MLKADEKCKKYTLAENLYVQDVNTVFLRQNKIASSVLRLDLYTNCIRSKYWSTMGFKNLRARCSHVFIATEVSATGFKSFIQFVLGFLGYRNNTWSVPYSWYCHIYGTKWKIKNNCKYIGCNPSGPEAFDEFSLENSWCTSSAVTVKNGARYVLWLDNKLCLINNFRCIS